MANENTSSLSADFVDQIKSGSDQGLPIDTDLPHDVLLSFATHDKKRRGTGVNLVVPEFLGKAVIKNVSMDVLATLIDLGCSSAERRGRS